MKIGQRMHAMRDEEPSLETLSKTDTSIGGVSRAIKAQTTIGIRAKTTPPR